MGSLFWLSDQAWSAIEPHLPTNQLGARRVDDNRFNRWPRRGFWLKLVEALVDAGAVTRSTAIDSTYVKAQRSAFGGKGGLRARRSAARAAAGPPKSTLSPTSSAAPTR